MATSYQFGYNISVLNQPVTLVKQFLNESYSSSRSSSSSSTSSPATDGISEHALTVIWSLCTTLFVFGGMIGAFVIGFIADRFGRSVVPFLFGLGPMYMLEVVPFNLKGAMGTIHQLFITIGIAMGSLFGLNNLLGVEGKWPILLLLNAVPGVASLVIFPFLPDSPRFLMLVRKNKEGARKALQWLRRRTDVTDEITEMEEESKSQQGQGETYTIMKLLRTRELIPPLIVSIVLQLMQQLSGINAIFFYSTSIYLNAGVPVETVQYANLGTCVINVAMTFVVIPLMDRLGRRSLLLGPIAGMIVTLAVITVALNLQSSYPSMSYVSIICVLFYVVFFACGLGPIPNMITAEVFRQGPRARAMSLAGLANWLSNAVVAMGFEIVQAATKEFVFLIFLVIMVASLIFTYFKVPETKNKSFDEIANQFKSAGGRKR
ncbi:hypothetical protein HELRODRAFT_187011 [Helobdella robusta]|uniref:Major facilitator superfamily (MFS) profile domain-containing protein n=1 Tax=Helobdella robusta TaxID=6412 RepID=T1FP56_HELRO|nr:hypothetical protein HELRODRAFT_187011 [Helobdella robusta]ESO04687.1 hypothetical protein HELRODRAFT_187011 [Helobdella robusta]